MKISFNNNVVIKIIIFGMIGIMGMLTINKGIFMHTHKIGENKYISHSHPYDKSNDSEPLKSHQHTTGEFLFFHNIEILFPLFFLILTITHYGSKGYLYFDSKKSDYIFIFALTNKGRAPPFFI
jgi:hypothetical protein